MPGLWQPDATRKTLKLSSGGARYAWFAYSMVRQTKGRWGSGYGPDGMLGAPLALESVQLQVISEGLKTKPSQWLDVKLNGKQLYDKIGQWVTSEKFGSIGGPRVYREWYIQTPKKTGKALALDTLIPTPTGWTTMGDVHVGMEVIGPDGRPCRVVGATEPMLGRECWEVEFSDGERIVADGEHLWETTTIDGARRIRTTNEIRDSLLRARDGARNHRIDLASPLELPESNLPVDPYVLGVWLADGHTAGARVTTGDAWIMEEVARRGYVVRKNSHRFNYGIAGLAAGLRAAGVLGEKRIPAAYMRASRAQRADLIAGLVDSDGHIDARKGRCELTLTNEQLATDAIALLRTLGVKPLVRESRAMLNGRDVGPRWRIGFTVYRDSSDNLVRLPRKRARLAQRPDRRPRSESRHVVAIRPHQSVPVRCIQVDRTDGLFLVSRALIPTHNSTLSSSLGLYFTGFDGEPGAEVYTLAAGKGQARTVFDQARQMVLKSPLLMDEFKVWKDVIEHPASGSIFRVLAADADYNEGFHPHCVIIDELHVHKTREMYDAMTSHLHTGAREDPIAIIITNAGDDEESICYEVYSQAKDVIEGRPDAREDLYTWVPELSPDDIYNEAKWSIVMPMSWQTPKMMAEAKKKFPEYVFLRRYLNVWTDAELPWLPYEIWDYAGDKDIVVPKGVPIVVAGDMGMTKDTSALAWAGVIPDCTCKTKGGEDQRDPSEHYEGCRFGEVIVGSHIWGIRQRDRAKDPPCHTLIKGDRFPIKLLRNYVEDVLHPDCEILEFVYDKWQMEQLAQDLSDEGLNMVEFPQNDTRMIPASEDLWNVITRDDLLTHPADPVLTKHVMAGVVSETGRGWRIDKKKTKKPCDGLIAMMMAVTRALHNFREGAPSFTVLG